MKGSVDAIQIRDYVSLAGVCRFFRHQMTDAYWLVGPAAYALQDLDSSRHLECIENRPYLPTF
jgi:hypothetical protein